ncbi:heat shock factor family protein [Skeletonema marinoi]|uniref:Heat shock factor family protein n=1 Tax=Skeletonema marinoi TaxID=267567 RepID=A0AAD8XTB1_9STRA|nr:heat shock factor family protein [Skeletonema marinoi]
MLIPATTHININKVLKEMNVNQPTPTSNINLSASSSSTPRRTKSEFPIKVYAMLELADNIFEFAQAVTWLPHGRAFKIHDKVKFMNHVVPVFFNQTKIRSFNRQLYMWGFRRIGRGDEQVWFHDNFLRGKPEDMKHMVRTKIKGNTAVSNEDVSVPNFDDLPPLPVCDRRPTAILDEMEHAILTTMPIASGDIARCGSTMRTVSPPQPGNFTGDNNTDHQMIHFNVDCNQDESFQFSGESHHSPLQADTNTMDSTQPMHQARTSVEEPSHSTYSHMNMLREDVNDFCFSPLKQNKEDFEPLPVIDDNAPCDDFASFIEGAIQLIKE